MKTFKLNDSVRVVNDTPDKSDDTDGVIDLIDDGTDNNTGKPVVVYRVNFGGATAWYKASELAKA